MISWKMNSTQQEKSQRPAGHRHILLENLLSELFVSKTMYFQDESASFEEKGGRCGQSLVDTKQEATASL